MTTIRKQSIISSGVVYLGFGLGAITNFIFARFLTPDQYGLINGMFMAIGNILYSLACLGMPAVVSKFYPYYRGNLPARKNDLMSWALLVTLGSFALVTIAGVAFRGQVVHYYQAKSPAFVTYYYWLFPFAFGLTIYTLLEYYAWQLKKPVLTNYLREIQFRLTMLVLLVLYLLGVIHDFGTLIKLYAFDYVLISIILLIYLMRSGDLHLVFEPSVVTRKFFKKMRALALLAWSGGVVYNLSFFFAQIVIAAVVPGGLTSVGLFTLPQLAGSIIQAPQRGLAAASIGPLSQAWREKDHGRIARIYQRSSISLLIFSVGMFGLMLINYRDGIITFGFPRAFLNARPVFIFIGLARVVDLGTGVTAQIMSTSTRWRFDFLSGLILVSLTLPLNYFLAKRIGIIGPAVADLFTFTVYNGIRWIYLYRNFRFQPFTRHTAYTLLLGGVAYLGCEFLFGGRYGLLWLFVRSISFLLIYGGGVLVLNLSEDIGPVWNTIRKRIKGVFS
ncbi:MAG TPA: polysaccharide biosynthesis C-terminal domain-containing protein [Puia sp.]|nr:polysaccharide biosynthesis C-terminal domain-containing protein [Puia sp.]